MDTGMDTRRMAPDIIQLFYKKGNTLQCNNYRPITLLNALYKVLSSTLFNRLRFAP